MQFFRELLGSANVLTDPDDLMTYNMDWIQSVRGNSFSFPTFSVVSVHRLLKLRFVHFHESVKIPKIQFGKNNEILITFLRDRSIEISINVLNFNIHFYDLQLKLQTNFNCELVRKIGG